MKLPTTILILTLVSSLCLGVLQAAVPEAPPQTPQAPPAPPAPPPPPIPPGSELGKWWKNSTIVREVGLKDSQIEKIEQVFLSHREALGSLNGKVRQAEKQLKPILDADKPDEAKVRAQLDQVLAARNDLERENSMMMLAIRNALTLDQWKRLQEIQSRRSAPPLPPPPPPAPPAPPSPSVPSADEPLYVVGGGVHPPIVVVQPLPPYTQEARDANIEGVVLLQCLIRKDGSVGQIKVLRGIGHGLDESAVKTIRSEWRFKPGTKNGVPVNVLANVEVSFRRY